MGLRSRTRLAGKLFFVASALLVIGCDGGGGPKGAESKSYKSIGDMSDVYVLYMTEHNRQPPKSEQAFRDFLNSKQEILARVGEPFFTTKPAGRGMGLGLFLARTVVERLGGAVTLDSVERHGTTARIAVPLRAEPSE